MGRVRKKKHILYVCLAALGIYGILQAFYLYDDNSYTPLRPLYNAKNEASRLLKFLSSYHYQCNTTTQIGNRSYWPICLETDMAIDLESKERKISYSVGPSYDYVLEKNLAANCSFRVFIIGKDTVPNHVRRIPNITVIKTNLMPNDYADFSRNSYGQSTLNVVMEKLKHKRIELLKLQELSGDASIWELLHFLISDNLLQRTKQLFIQVSIEKLDDDYLYNWYRVLYDLFYKAGFRLYHTAASDSLCLQVTLMESCVYYMSWIHDPGPTYFVMHPPAGYGTFALEESRLMTFLSTGHISCGELKQIKSKTAEYDVCIDSFKQADDRPCIIYTFSQRSETDDDIEKQLLTYGCIVYQYVLSEDDRIKSPGEDILHQPILRSFTHRYNKEKTPHGSKTLAQSVERIGREDKVSLILIDLNIFDWILLDNAMSTNSIKNVSQIVMNINLASKAHGKHPIVLRRKNSELNQLSRHGFKIFNTQELVNKYTSSTPDVSRCCYQIGFLKRSVSSSLKYRSWVR